MAELLPAAGLLGNVLSHELHDFQRRNCLFKSF
jgi:hypothetical protein